MEHLKLPKYRILGYFLLTLIIHLISYTYYGSITSIIFALFGLILLLFNFTNGLSFFFTSILLFDDINKYDIDLPQLNSIFTVNFLGMSISMMWSVLIFGLILIMLLNSTTAKQKVALPLISVLILLFIGASRIYQFRNPSFITDVGFIINILLGYALGIKLLQSDDKISYYFIIVLIIFLSKYLIITVHGVYASLSGVFYTLKGESAANYLIVPLALGLLVIFNNRLKLHVKDKFLTISLLIIIISYLFITITRERIIFTALTLLTYSILYKKIRIIFYIGMISVATALFILMFNPNMYSFIQWKLTTFLPTSNGVVSASSSVRLIELKNIWNEQLESPYKLLIGNGWGGFFTSEHVPFTKEILGTKSFPEEWIQNDTFFKPHGTLPYVLLKYGLLGTLLLYGSLLIYCFKNVFDTHVYRNQKSNESIWWLRYIQIALCITLPIGFLVIFTSKLQILSGFFLATIYSVKKSISKAVNTEQKD